MVGMANALSGLATCTSLASLAGLCQTKAVASAGNWQNFEPFSFAFVSDTHLTNGQPDNYKLLQESQLFLQEVVKELNNQRLDFIIFGGDQVEGPGKDQANWSLFQDIAQTLTAPWSFILGEKDIASNYPQEKLQAFGADWRSHGIETKAPYWSLNPLKTVHIIGLDTSVVDNTVGFISNDQMEWLKKDLSANQDKVTVVFSHHPLLPPPPFDSESSLETYLVTKPDPVRQILAANPQVRMSLSGHVHINHTGSENGIWYISCPSLNVYPCAYKVFHVSPEEIVMETHSVNFPALVKKAKGAFLAESPLRQSGINHAYKLDELANGSKTDHYTKLSLIAEAANTKKQGVAKRK
jgi:3',5'-cyclic AMP phosphodiesterase CpdA